MLRGGKAGFARRIQESLALVRRGASPRSPIAPQTAATIAAAFPKLAKTAVEPVFLTGKDLAAAGLKPGPEYRRILDEAARAQWSGAIVSRAEALRWLRARI